jgi:hypothetical protein
MFLMYHVQVNLVEKEARLSVWVSDKLYIRTKNFKPTKRDITYGGLIFKIFLILNEHALSKSCKAKLIAFLWKVTEQADSKWAKRQMT